MNINFRFFRVMATIVIAAGVVFGQTDINEVIDPNFDQDVTENEEETSSLQTDSETEIGAKVDLSMFLLRSGFWAKTYYHHPDGTPVKYKQMREMIAVAPENETLLKQEKRWRVSSVILAWVFLASIATDASTLFVENDNYRAQINQINIPIQTLSFLYSIVTSHVSNVKLQQSIDNYNYYIAKQPEK